MVIVYKLLELMEGFYFCIPRFPSFGGIIMGAISVSVWGWRIPQVNSAGEHPSVGMSYVPLYLLVLTGWLVLSDEQMSNG